MESGLIGSPGVTEPPGVTGEPGEPGVVVAPGLPGLVGGTEPLVPCSGH